MAYRVKSDAFTMISLQAGIVDLAVKITLGEVMWGIVQVWDCSDFWLNSDFLCWPGEENLKIFVSTNKEILHIGLLLWCFGYCFQKLLGIYNPRGYQTVEMASFQHTFEFVSKFQTFLLVMTLTPW